MGAKIDLTGRIYGYWYVNKFAGRSDWHELLWDCTCTLCNRNYVVNGSALKNGKSRMCLSCSAKRKTENQRKAADASRKSGLSTTKLYQVLANAHRRCEDATNRGYPNYGARGIKVCKEWSMENVGVFYEWAMENGYKEGLQLDRIDVNGDYCPENCRWVTIKENCRNRRTNRIVHVHGEDITLAEAVEKYSTLPYHIVLGRILYYGYSPEDALSKPLRHNAKK